MKKVETSNRFIFIRQGRSDRMPEIDLILELNIKIKRIEKIF